MVTARVDELLAATTPAGGDPTAEPDAGFVVVEGADLPAG